MCLNNNIPNKKELFKYKECFISYLSYVEIGQTELLMEIYKNYYKALIRIDKSLIKLIIQKILPKKIIPLLNESIIDNKKSQSTQNF